MALEPRRPPASAAGDLVVFGDALSAGWQNWSWSATVDFANAAPARGSASVSADFTAPWAGLSLRIDPALNAADHAAVAFWAHGGASGTRPLDVFIQQSDGGGETARVAVDAPAGTWTPFTISLASLGNPAAIKRLNVQDRSGADQPVFYVDDIGLIGAAAPPPAALTATIVVSPAGGNAIDPRLLGSNLPAWLGPARLQDAAFRARTIALGVTVLRLPGGSWSNGYGWLSCELRANQPGAEPCGDGWASWIARPTDFLDFLQATGAQGMWVANPNGTSHEAAALLAFFNSPLTDTAAIGVDVRGTNWYTAGHWAALRAAHGNPDPHPIRLWAVGNEVYAAKPLPGDPHCTAWGWEDFWTCQGAEYVNGVGAGAARHEGYREFRDALRAADPGVEVGAVGSPTPGEYDDWGHEVMAAAAGALDYYDVHAYAYFNPPASMADALAQPPLTWPPLISATRGALVAAGAAGTPIAVTEHNLFSAQDQDTGQWLTRMVNALFVADTIGQMAVHGVSMANQWALANGRAGNGTEYGLMHEDNGYFRSPQYYAFVLWSRFGGWLLPATANLSPADQLSIYAGRADPRTFSVLAINKTADPITATVRVEGRRVIGGWADTVAAPSLAAQTATFNGQADPAHDLGDAPSAAVAIVDGAVAHVFPPHSITLIRASAGCGPAPVARFCVFVPVTARVTAGGW